MKVTCRMYNAGFGDCFLLTVPAPERSRKILIDCGKHTLSATGPRIGGIVEAVLKDVEEDGEPRIDIVIATHRHLDHVNGFGAKGWQDVHVGEVWMPWTEDPEDQTARKICEQQSSRALQARLGISALALSEAQREYLLGYAGNNLKNAAAMNLLHQGFKGNPRRRFLPEQDDKKGPLRTDLLPGVETYVLGPPRDQRALREMDPPKSESFLRAWAMQSNEVAHWPSSFDDRFALSREEYEKRLREAKASGDVVGAVESSFEEDFPVESEARICGAIDEPAMELLAKLEEAVNATSLVLLFHVGDAWMLFPGDAQWGTWNAILNDPSRGKLLENLTFYKIGHHGSHNATPISFVKRYMNKSVTAMLPYGKVDKWPTIPRAKLMETLDAKGVAVARADEPPAGPFKTRKKAGETLAIDVNLTV